MVGRFIFGFLLLLSLSFHLNAQDATLINLQSCNWGEAGDELLDMPAYELSPQKPIYLQTPTGTVLGDSQNFAFWYLGIRESFGDLNWADVTQRRSDSHRSLVEVNHWTDSFGNNLDNQPDQSFVGAFYLTYWRADEGRYEVDCGVVFHMGSDGGNEDTQRLIHRVDGSYRYIGEPLTNSGIWVGNGSSGPTIRGTDSTSLLQGGAGGGADSERLSGASTGAQGGCSLRMTNETAKDSNAQINLGILFVGVILMSWIRKRRLAYIQ